MRGPLARIVARLQRTLRRRKGVAVQWDRCSFTDTEKGARRQAELVSALNAATSSTATGRLSLLDVGCGKGRLRRSLDERFRYVGMEYGSGMASVARAAMPDAPVVNGSIEALPFRDCGIDVVVAQGVVETLPNYKAAVTEMLRVARRVVVIATPIAERDITGEYEVPDAGWTRSNAWSRDGIKRLAESLGAQVREEHRGGRGLFVLMKGGW